MTSRAPIWLYLQNLKRVWVCVKRWGTQLAFLVASISLALLTIFLNPSILIVSRLLRSLDQAGELL